MSENKKQTSMDETKKWLLEHTAAMSKLDPRELDGRGLIAAGELVGCSALTFSPDMTKGFLYCGVEFEATCKYLKIELDDLPGLFPADKPKNETSMDRNFIAFHDFLLERKRVWVTEVNQIRLDKIIAVLNQSGSFANIRYAKMMFMEKFKMSLPKGLEETVYIKMPNGFVSTLHFGYTHKFVETVRTTYEQQGGDKFRSDKYFKCLVAEANAVPF